MGRRDDDSFWGWVTFVVAALALLYLVLAVLASGRARGDALHVGDAFTGKGVKDVSAKAAICAAALALSCGGGVDGAGLAPGRTPMLVPGVDSGPLVRLQDGAGADGARAADVAADLALIDSALAAADVPPAVVPDAAVVPPDALTAAQVPSCFEIQPSGFRFLIQRQAVCPFAYMGLRNVQCFACSGEGPQPAICRFDESGTPPRVCVRSCAECPPEFRGDGGAL